MPSEISDAYNVSSKTTRAHRFVEELLNKAGLNINGPAPWDMQLNEPGAPERALSKGNLGLGDAYVEGQWDSGQLDEFFSRLMRSRLTDNIHPASLIFHALSAKLFNRQDKSRAWQVGEQHYDQGNPRNRLTGRKRNTPIFRWNSGYRITAM